MAKKKAENSENAPGNPAEKMAGGQVVQHNIVAEMKDSYLDYAMSVITMRALPDVRDGLKPVQRRVLFVMHELGLSAGAKFRKCAKIAGDTSGNYHPHGETNVYGALVNLAQDFGMRYKLIQGQGNFGSVDGDPPAAMRYTEARLTRISGELIRDIDKNTVDWRPNYDGTRKEPIVLPASVPNLLLNGTLGIAVGMATNIAPHNLRELIDASVYLIDNPKASTEDLFQFVKGPDFPTGGMVFSEKDIHHAYATGRGGVVTRGHAEIIDEKGNSQIVITSLPYRVNKATLIKAIADLVRDKKIEGIKGLNDLSAKGDTLVVVDLRSTAHPQKILNYLYKHTQLEDTFHFNMVALVNGIPQTLSLKAMLQEFIAHRLDVVTRRTQFELDKAEAREHILLGLKKALDNIDKIIKLIRAAKDAPDAHAQLMKAFKFSEKQATAILEMRLQKLAGLERKKVEDELKELQKIIADLKALLSSPKKIFAVIKKELAAIYEKYGDDRKTKVIKHGIKSISLEDLIPEEESVLVLTSGGYLKRTNPDEYRKQKRGGVGVIDLNTKEEDFVTQLLTTNTHSDLLFFTDTGKVYQIKMYDVPEGKRSTRGKSVMNFLSLSANEKVSSVIAMPKSIKEKDQSLMMVTKQGVVKRVAAKSFHDVRVSGIIAIKLADGDELISASFVSADDTAILVTQKGQSIRFKIADIREMGRSAGGVRGINLGKDDAVVSAGVIKETYDKPHLLVISEHGYGKQTKFSEYKIQKRGGSGIKTAQVTAKTGKIISAQVIFEEGSEIVAMSQKGQVIRTDVEGVATLGRQTQGVRIMKLRAGDSLASLICL
ncbi:DNA gyrase subunit A [Candidatus Wolfebacteria bacterium]|nr:MAG: DNA gyrase subunit A [Candidatus Wolfebacteria bacterium]